MLGEENICLCIRSHSFKFLYIDNLELNQLEENILSFHLFYFMEPNESLNFNFKAI